MRGLLPKSPSTTTQTSFAALLWELFMPSNAGLLLLLDTALKVDNCPEGLENHKASTSFFRKTQLALLIGQHFSGCKLHESHTLIHPLQGLVAGLAYTGPDTARLVFRHGSRSGSGCRSFSPKGARRPLYC